MQILTSRQNPIIQDMKKLCSDTAYRRTRNMMVGRGKKLLDEAIKTGVTPETVLFSETEPECGPSQLIRVPAELLDYIARDENELVFTCPIPEQKNDFDTAVILDGVQDPGNLGTVVRTAAAFGVDTVIMTGECADPYSPKALRASMGAGFRMNILQMSVEELGTKLKEKGIVLCAAMLSTDAEDIRSLDKNRKLALAVGNEGHGLSDGILALSAEKIIIPMDAQTESLNAAAAAAVAIWELFGRERRWSRT